MYKHVPVLLEEVLLMLSPKEKCIYLDGTFGGGGYTKSILDVVDCKVIACDRDSSVRDIACEFKSIYQERFDFLHAKFSDIRSVISSFGVKKLDGIILDLGVSNFQLSDPGRGFSFRLNGPLNMGMGLCEETALDVIRKYSERELADIIYEFGEERFSRRIAKNIKMNLSKISTTEDLANIIRLCVKKTSKINVATKTFQALRIFVNDELDELQQVLSESIELLNRGGKIIVVTFHSLEDRIVKRFFKSLIVKENPIKFKLLNKKPIVPSKNEILLNSKARSAKLRGISML
ncbi:MAG: 16S rRNA (cytosine(1402)-N(4))-methyltransferase RsmH [Holosporaceae bacterium]|jgi:16S rRNA (cytosine1402-N4)-methyltransferase|nr:16S rRNA (cytosine(1402)-N(4))-methyltransferase RsmH [Holosporaceae bacterium]